MSDRDDTKQQSKQALLEMYLRGDFPQGPLTANKDSWQNQIELPDPVSRAVPVQTGGSRRPFFYLHGDWRGQAFYCYPLAHSLGPEQPFYVLEPYSFDGLPVPPSFETMAAAHIKSMCTIQPEGPYLLGGWCNGGLIAYEMALQLLAKGQKVELLVLMDADGPHPGHRRLIRSVVSCFCNLMRLSPDKQVDTFLLIQHIFRYLLFSHYRRSKNSEHLETIEQEECKPGSGKAGFVPPRFDLLFPSTEELRRDWPAVYEWIAYGYVPGRLYPGKITFFWDSADTWRRKWWRKVIEAKGKEVEVHILPGTHYTLRMEDVGVLAEHLRACISEVQTSAL